MRALRTVAAAPLLCLLLMASSCSSCSTRELPLSPGNEAQCLDEAAYRAVESRIRPRLKARVLNDEIAFLDERVRRDHLFVQLRHRYRPLAEDYHVHVAIEVDGQPLEHVPINIEALAKRTGEQPQSDAQESARGLIIWATGGIALLSKKVTAQPTHVQLLALLGRKPCKIANCENLQIMFERPPDETAPAELVLTFDFTVEDEDGVRQRACPPAADLRVALPAGATLEQRLQSLFQDKLRVMRERKR
jgi:hypothetical protein